MRIIDTESKTILNPDLSKGTLIPALAIKENVEPVDDVKKSAYTDDDFEKVMMYIPEGE